MIEKIDFETCEILVGNYLVIIDNNFDRLFNDNQSQGLARFQDDKGCNWVNINGYELTNKRYKDVGDFTKEGFATFEDDKGYAWVNSTGKPITDKRYDRADDFTQGFAKFRDDKGYAWVNSTGKPITDKRYYEASDFTQGFALFFDNTGWAYRNTLGFEFRSVEFTWYGNTYDKDFENNKEKLFKLEEKLLNDFFPKTSMKYYLLQKFL